MKAFKQFALGMLASAVLVALLRSWLCAWLCGECPPALTCHVANPKVEFNVVGGNFGLTSDVIAGADSVTIDVYGNDGALAQSYHTADGAAQIVNVPTTPRPLQLVFTYTGASNNVVARDSLIIDDRQNGGGPATDIIMGIHNPADALKSCVDTSNTVTVTTSGVYKIFNWEPGKVYTITLNRNGTVKRFLLKTVFNGPQNRYDFQCWGLEEYESGCLLSSESEMSNIGSQTGKVIVINPATFVLLTGEDNGDGNPRTVRIRFNSCDVTVKSN